MIDSFKKVIGYYALCYIVKYTPVVQEKFNKEVLKKPRFLALVPNYFKTQNMCERADEDDPDTLRFVPDHFKTQGMCEKNSIHPEVCS